MSRRAVPSQHARAPVGSRIPLSLVRDLVAVSLLTEDVQVPARLRLERLVGVEFASRLLDTGSTARHAA